MSGFNDKIEEMKKERRSFFGPNILQLCEQADVVFLGLHGANGEDGKVQAAFDLMGIRYTGTGYLSSAMAMDKGITKQMFLMNNVPTPRGTSMLKSEMTTDIKALGMDFPVVVKTCCGGSSVGVYIANDQAEYEQALKDAYSYENEVVIEEYIKGREFSVAVVDGKAYPIIEIDLFRDSMTIRTSIRQVLQLRPVRQNFPLNLLRKCSTMQKPVRKLYLWKATAVLTL